MAEADFYELLQVERGADEKTIKSAYRRLAMECHPDRNPGCDKSEAKFKAISHAYDVLKDPQKRAAYDRYGHAAFQNGGGGAGPQGFDGFADIFENIFGEFMAMAGRTAMRRSSVVPTCATTSRLRSKRPIMARPSRSASMSRRGAIRARARAPSRVRRRAAVAPAMATARYARSRVSSSSNASARPATAAAR